VIQASGAGYYGSHGDEPITEDVQAGQGFLPGVSIEWEASTAPVEALGVRRPIIRTSPVLSGIGGVLPRIVNPFRYFVGGPVGDGGQWFPWIHIADEVGAIRFLVENDQAKGPFNLAAPNPVTNGDLARLVGQTLGRPAAIRIPGAILRILFGEMAALLLDSQRVLPRRLQDLGFSFRFPELETALRDLLK
jgi:uncharacterized protein (TIGR01777 family)